MRKLIILFLLMSFPVYAGDLSITSGGGGDIAIVGGGGVSDHDLLNNLNWGSAGHTFDTDLDLGAYKITASSFTIGANTLNAIEWTFLDDIDQAVKTTSNVRFASIGIGQAPAAGNAITALLTAGTGISVIAGDYDVNIWRIGYDTSNYGFYQRYIGTGSGINNALELWTEGQASTDVKVYKITQDGAVNFQANPITTTGLLTTGTFKLTTSPSNGYVLTSDASGTGTWQVAGAGSQTPWASDIDGGSYDLTNVDKIYAQAFYGNGSTLSNIVANPMGEDLDMAYYAIRKGSYYYFEDDYAHIAKDYFCLPEGYNNFYFYDGSWGGAVLYAEDYLTFSQVYDISSGPALPKIKNATDWLKPDGTLDYARHYASKLVKDPTGKEKYALSLEQRIATLEQAIYELKMLIEGGK